MPVEFLTDDEAAAYGRYVGVPSRAELERVFFLDDEDRALIEHRRGDHMRLGFGLQLVTVRYVGMFLEDPLDVPVVVLDFVAEQLNIADPSCVKRYTERAKTRFDHQWEIRRVCGLTEFAAVEAELRAWVAARSWTSGDGPKAIFTDAVGWLREREVLLPGVSTLVRLVARVRDDTTRRLWGVVEGLLTAGQRSVLDQLLEVPPGSRVSDLERWRKGPPPRGSGPAMIKALDQVAEVMGLGMAGLGADGGEQGEGPQAAAAGQGLGPAGGRGGGVVRLRWVGRPGRGRSGGAGVGGDRGGGVPVGAAGRAGAGERECAAGGRGRGR